MATIDKTARARRQPPAERRQDLLDVTIRCLATLGPRATTGREVCRQAGVSHGLLRHYFANPDDLLIETYQEVCARFLARFEAELADTADDPRAAMTRFFEATFSDEWANSDIQGAWMAFWTLVRGNEGFAAVGEDYNRRLTSLLAATIDRLPLALPAEDAAMIIGSVVDGLWLDLSLSPKRMTRERAVALCEATLGRLLSA